MKYPLDNLFLWVTASTRKYFDAQPFGIQKIYLQAYSENDKPARDQVEILIEGPDLKVSGTKSEQGTLIVWCKLIVKTTYCETDIYYHNRIKARVAESLNKNIPVARSGYVGCDNKVIGFLKPMETLSLTPVNTDEPDISVIDRAYLLELC